ncbi:MAG: EAL domain-containing protein [Epsilonproteobacteria bacterium]|nr:EAL domain-containing protein [Campylobacterota bacterium]
MERTKNLKLKLLLIFLFPAVGMLYFSFDYVHNKFEQYQKTVYLEEASVYVDAATHLIKELQKERGLSVASLTSQDYFSKKLVTQRELSDKAYNRFSKLFPRVKDAFQADLLKRFIERYREITIIRKKVDAGELDVFGILNYYSSLVEKLIGSASILKNVFVNERFYKLSNGYDMLLNLAENNGRERALISWLLVEKKDNKAIRQYLYDLEIQTAGLSVRMEKEGVLTIAHLYQQYVPKDMEEAYTALKKRIIFDRDLSGVSGEHWWQLATQYINAIYQVNGQIIRTMWQLRDKLKEEAYRALVLSLVLWIGALAALYALVLIFTRIINAYGRQVSKTIEQKKLYRAFSEYSEVLIYNEDEQVLLGTMCVILMQTEKFDHLWIAKVDREGKIEPVVTENIASVLITQAFEKGDRASARLKKAIRQLGGSGKYEILLRGVEASALYDQVESFGLFSLFEKDNASYVLVAGAKKNDELNAWTIDLLGRMVGGLRYAMEKIALKREDEELKASLKVMASVFETHEAITITDAFGKIVKVNRAFTRITGYEPEEVIGKNPSVLKSGEHDKAFYNEMWDAIRKKGFWKGEIINKRKNGEIYPEMLSISAVKNEKGEITHYVAHFFDITDLKAAQRQAEYRAQHDPLTDLYNRQKLLEELERIYEKGRQDGYYSAFLFFDLDNFKQINDFYTHEIGDKVLVRVAERLRSFAFENDIVARIAGDEFAFIAVDIDKQRTEAIKKVSILLEKIRKSFERTMEVDGHEVEISFSIGVKIFPDDEKSAQDVVVDADVAMYHAKRNGKNQYKFFDERLDLEAKQFIVLKNEFTKALERGELLVHYQPQVEIGTGRICGLEAMVRWRHPERGLLYPDSFIHVVTSNRLNFALTVYVLKQVAVDLKKWKKVLKEFPLRIAINISGGQFNQKDFEKKILDVIREMEIEPKALEFEIVEDILMKDIDHSVEMIRRFKQYGFSFSIDDFGTGYSSINYLKRLPVDSLKIDKSFVLENSEGNSVEIVKMIIQTAKIFGLKSIAEGVEDEETLQMLASFGCDCYQGYHFSPAVDADRVVALLKGQ